MISATIDPRQEIVFKQVMNFNNYSLWGVVVYTLLLGKMHETTPQGGIELFNQPLPR